MNPGTLLNPKDKACLKVAVITFYILLNLGTSSKIAVDGKINRICKDYSCLTTKDAKRHALTYIACNLGITIEIVIQTNRSN